MFSAQNDIRNEVRGGYHPIPPKKFIKQLVFLNQKQISAKVTAK